MPKKRNPPCTGSNDKTLLKNGCPEKFWDGQEGCPKWKEYTQPGKPGEPPIVIKGCTDILMEHWQFEALKMLEGNQQATESFRNGMCEEVDGQVVPKMDRAVIGLVSILQRGKEDRQLLDQAGKTKKIESS